jgi:beta-phosphoglucomutase
VLAAVIFDFDGVLADSEPLHLQVFKRVLRRIGVELTDDDYYSRYLGYSDEDSLRVVARDRGLTIDEATVAALADEKTRIFRSMVAETDVLFDGAADTVRRIAAEVPVAIASGALSDEIALMLGPSGLAPLFPVIVGANHTTRSKPAPDPYRCAFEQLIELGHVPQGTSPAFAVAIEDSTWGIESARGAGLRCVGVTTSYAAHQLAEADLVVPTVAALTMEALHGIVSTPAKAAW